MPAYYYRRAPGGKEKTVKVRYPRKHIRHLPGGREIEVGGKHVETIGDDFDIPEEPTPNYFKYTMSIAAYCHGDKTVFYGSMIGTEDQEEEIELKLTNYLESTIEDRCSEGITSGLSVEPVSALSASDEIQTNEVILQRRKRKNKRALRRR